MKKIISLIIVCFYFIITTNSQEIQDTIKFHNKPKAEYCVGNAKVTVWENQHVGKYGEFAAKNFKIEKIYKKNDKWESTNYFDLNELLQLRAAIDKAISEEGVKKEQVSEENEKK